MPVMLELELNEIRQEILAIKDGVEEERWIPYLVEMLPEYTSPGLREPGINGSTPDARGMIRAQRRRMMRLRDKTIEGRVIPRRHRNIIGGYWREDKGLPYRFENGDIELDELGSSLLTPVPDWVSLARVNAGWRRLTLGSFIPTQLLPLLQT